MLTRTERYALVYVAVASKIKIQLTSTCTIVFMKFNCLDFRYELSVLTFSIIYYVIY